MGDAARQEDVDHALGFGFDEVVVLLFGASLANAKVIAQRQPESGQGTNGQETASVWSIGAQTHTEISLGVRSKRNQAFSKTEVVSSATQVPGLVGTVDPQATRLGWDSCWRDRVNRLTPFSFGIQGLGGLLGPDPIHARLMLTKAGGVVKY